MRLLAEGQVIRDTYKVERFLGEGAFAEVYRVKHRFLGRQAMKIFKRVGMDLAEIEDMLGEARILTHIGHPNIVRVYDANVLESDQGRCGYFTMESISGGSLDKFWQSHGGKFVPIETTLDIIKQVCRGIGLAHKEQPPIIHRDIKPQNILVGYEADGLRARVSDFGLAKKVNQMTLMATAAGTLPFKSPEAFTVQKSDSCAGDVWALGMTLYLLHTDKLPYEVPAQFVWGVADFFDKPLIPPSSINPDSSAALDQIVSRALHKDPRKRFLDANEMHFALDQWKPGTSGSISKSQATNNDMSKLGLGPAPQLNKSEADSLVKKSLKAVKAGRLAEAADLMEEAFNKLPDLRHRYAPQVKMWRCGVSM